MKVEESLFSKMMKGDVELKKVNEAIFINRNPSMFPYVLDFMSDETPKKVTDE